MHKSNKMSNQYFNIMNDEFLIEYQLIIIFKHHFTLSKHFQEKVFFDHRFFTQRETLFIN